MATIPKPTDAELEILEVLWNQGPSTVRRIFEELQSRREVGYTTVLKMCQIMTEKGLVVRDSSRRSHIYAPSQPQGRTQRQLIGHLARRAFGGSPAKLAMHALSSESTSTEELAEIRRLLDDLEGK